MALRKNPRFDLKRKYWKSVEIAAILSLCTVTLAFIFIPNLDSEIRNYEVVEASTWDPVDPPVTKQLTSPPPPRPKVIIPDIDDNLIPDITCPPNNPEEFIKLKNLANSVNLDNAVNKYFVVVDEMPSIIGGYELFKEKIKNQANDNNLTLEGKVSVEAFVSEIGSIGSARILRGTGGEHDKIAINSIMEAKFHPGKRRGKPVKVRIAIPVVFPGGK